MPNWCDNHLQICGSDDAVAKFMKENVNRDNELSFAMSCPVPEELGDWDYYWCRDNWGTKWDATDSQVEDSDIHFNTAWGPPTAWLEKVAEKYSTLSFTLRYAESGCGFSGVLKYVDGILVTELDGKCGDYFGYKYCHNCQEELWWEYCDFDMWKDDFNMCAQCFNEACITIKNAVRSKKIQQLPKKLACRRMGRNPIMDNYLMCKVFIPRLNECVA